MFYTSITFQIGLATLTVLNSHMRLVAAKFDSAVVGFLLGWKTIPGNERTPRLRDEEVEAVPPK